MVGENAGELVEAILQAAAQWFGQRGTHQVGPQGASAGGDRGYVAVGARDVAAVRATT